MDSAKFLADKNDIRQYLTVPMIIDGIEVCTNGHVMICTPVIGEETRVADGTPEYVLTSMRRMLGKFDGFTDWREPPEIIYPEKVACDTCGGIGKAKKIKCPDCDGDGAHYFFEGCHEYECECKECDGAGEVITGNQEEGDTCEDCCGDGMVFDLNYSLNVCGVWVNPYYYQLIDKAPGLKLCSNPGDLELYFRAGEQFGIIMGMREPRIELKKVTA